MIAKTPRGFKDVLPEEARIRERLRKDAARAMDLWGYDPLETPSLEFVDVLEIGSNVDTATFRLFDDDGNLLVMRPDVTLPIARMVASRLRGGETVHRFRYDQRVFRDNESSKGHSREFTQLGVEQIGLAGPKYDAETIIVFIESLLATGLRGFKIEFCDVRALNGLLASCGCADAAFSDEVRTAFHTSNSVRLDSVVAAAGLDERAARALTGLIRLNGGEDAIDRCAGLLDGLVDPSVLDELADIWRIVAECGYAEYLGIDFSLLGSFDYYTGFIMEAFAPGFGKSLGSGGRYDNLLGAFGAAAPAAGFAFSLERLMHALAVQGNLDTATDAKQTVGTFAEAMELHGRGIAAQIGGAR